jgi:spermidine synthase
VQCAFLREYLAVFSGNELTVGLILSIWLCAVSLGSLVGTRSGGRGDRAWAMALLALLAVCGVYGIRASRLLFPSGALIGPLPLVGIIAASEAPFSFVSGYLFGALSQKGSSLLHPFGVENAGSLAGALLASACVLFDASNAAIVAIAGAAPLACLARRPVVFALALAGIAVMLTGSGASLHWKYGFPRTEVVYGGEGEIATMRSGGEVTRMLNGTVYSATAERPFLEQAVHLPLCCRPRLRAVLVIFDKGHCRELAQYAGASVDCIESEPRLAAPGCFIAAPESYRTEKRYDAVFLGAGLPQTAATNRFYTGSFFLKVKNLMTDSAVFSFTLPLSENYQSASERRLMDALKSTLGAVFAHVLVFPGNGFTFMASNAPLSLGSKPHVATAYLESSIMPSVSAARIAAANAPPAKKTVNTVEKPIGLIYGIGLWTELFAGTWRVGAGLVAALLLLCALLLPKSGETLSIGSTGFAVGIYSVAILLLYQSTYGLLYSRVSLLLCSLTLGFMGGTLLRRIPLPDLFIGAYCLVSLLLLSLVPYPPALLFYGAHAGAGMLAGAQFASMKKSPAGWLYAADCAGGAFGMILSVAMIPLFGITAVAGGLCALKCVVWGIGKIKK